MLQDKLVTVQRRIQEPYNIEERSLCDTSKWKTRKLSLLSQNAYFRCDQIPRFVLETE